MKINAGMTTNNPIIDSMAAKAAQTSRQATAPGQAQNEAAIVTLSSGSVDQLRQGLEDVPDVRNEQVQALRASVEQGTYNVDPSQVASAMFQNLFGQS